MPKPKRTINPSYWKNHPAKAFADRIRLHHWRKGADKPIWEASFLIDGVWTNPPFATGTTEEYEAAVIALEMFNRHATGGSFRQERAVRGQPGGSFTAAAAVVIARLDTKRKATTKAEGSRAANRFAAPINRIKILDRHFGSMQIAKIKSADVREWLDNLPKPPAQSTVGNYAHAWGMVMEEAVARGWLDEGAVVRMSKKGFAAGDQRPVFTRSEMQKLARHLRAPSDETETLVRAYIALAATTGIRAGREMERLRVGQVIKYSDRSFSIQVIATRSKLDFGHFVKSADKSAG